MKNKTKNFMGCVFLVTLSVATAFAGSLSDDSFDSQLVKVRNSILLQKLNHTSFALPIKVESTKGDSCMFNGRTGRPVSAQQAFGQAARSLVVYAGEEHGNAGHHRIEHELLNRLISINPGTAAGFEMLGAFQQKFLDQYLRGELTADEFQKAVDWSVTWGFPFNFYRPLFEALQSGSRLGVALNIPESVARKVADQGLDSLTPEERQSVPPNFQVTTDKGYLAAMRDILTQHNGGSVDAAALERLVTAMSLWNEGMAYNLQQFLLTHTGTPTLVIAGVFHAAHAGIPASLARRMPGVKQTSFIMMDAPSCPTRILPADLALQSDYIWVVTSH